MSLYIAQFCCFESSVTGGTWTVTYFTICSQEEEREAVWSRYKPIALDKNLNITWDDRQIFCFLNDIVTSWQKWKM